MSIVALTVALHHCSSDELTRQQRTSPTSAFPPPYDGSPNKSFKCLSQVSLAQRMCGGAERGSVNQLALYTSPSLPNITLGLPATATATAASNVRRTTAALRPRVVSTLLSIIPLFSRWPRPRRMGACSQRSPSALRFSPAATWLPTWPRQGQEQAGTPRTARCFNTWCWWSKAQHRAPWWQVRVKATRITLLQLVEAALVQLMRSTLQMFLWLKVLLRILQPCVSLVHCVCPRTQRRPFICPN